jgi:hypothetical protein
LLNLLTGEKDMGVRMYYARLTVSLCLLIIFAGHVHAQRSRGIRSVDFRNFTYQPSWVGDGRVTLRNGQFTDENGAMTELVAVEYADFNGDGQEDAAIAIGSEVQGTMAYVEDYYVYTYRNGALNQALYVQREKPKGMRVVGRSLLIAAPFWRSRDAHCCPSFDETVTYKWKGEKMVVASRRRVRSRN